MNAYHVQDRIEAQSWTRHYQQIAREEKESELAKELEGAIKQHHFESLAQEHFTRHLGGSKKAIEKAFDDDCEFQEKLAEFMCFMAETVARHQIDFEEEQ